MARGEAWEFNRRKTHCPRGHPYNEVNTAVRSGRRTCRTCEAARGRRDRAAARAVRMAQVLEAVTS